MKVGQRVMWESLQTPTRYFRGRLVRLESLGELMLAPRDVRPGNSERTELHVIPGSDQELWAIVEVDGTRNWEPVKASRLETIRPPTWKAPKGGGDAPSASTIQIKAAA